jgi:eukaryotic-like serine/threonine-protein kinase
MSLAAGTRLGSYEVVAPIGAGGMGEVYRARDTKLGRDVALKVLPTAFAADAERMSRFEREARLLAALNHPYIAAIYGLEESSGTPALVMELVEGPTLADRIAAGPIPLDESLPIAKQIAEALEYAHERGVIHRDLKPANIKVKADDTVKVLDFGLAKALTEDPATVDMSNSPTLSMGATMQGVILGTAAYMSPEQAKAKPADRRADIWAFGVVLCEMLTGKHLYSGETAAETLAAVIMKEPPIGDLPPNVPPAIRNLVRRCLARDARRRLQHIGEARIIIEDVLSGAAPDAPAETSAARGLPQWYFAALAAACGVLLVALAALTFVHFRGTPPPSRVVRFQIPLPGKTAGPIFQISPDGRYLAFTASEAGRRHLWIRPIDSLTAQAVTGAEDATYVFWSPDSASLAFFVPGKLKKVAVTGGPTQTICDARDGRGGSWSGDGVIVFSPGLGSPIERVSAAGGVPTAVTKIATPGEDHRYPVFLPDNKHFLYVVSFGKPETSGIHVGSLDGAPPVRILADDSSASYVAPAASGGSGLLLFRRESTLMGAPFDPRRLVVTGDVFPVMEEVGTSGNTSHAAFSVSSNGVLVYGAGRLQVRGDEMVWKDRTGKLLGNVGPQDQIFSQALSPDGKTVLFTIFNNAGDASDLWALDVARGVPTRSTFRPGTSTSGIWSPDGNTIAFESDNRAIYTKPANGAGKEELIGEGVNIRPLDWSRDGKFIVYEATGETTGSDLWLLPLEGDHKAIPYLQTPFNEGEAQFSPDGHWMAYASNESGQPQVYVQAIPASGAKWQVSAAGGVQPRWRRDGKELFYISADQKLMAVPVETGPGFEAGAPQPLFEIDPLFPALLGLFAYQPAADGQRFLVLEAVGGTTTLPINVVLNWQVGLKK